VNGRLLTASTAPEEATPSPRSSAAERLENPEAFLTRTDLAELGLTRTMIDGVIREITRTEGVVFFPGTQRPAVRVASFRALVERSTYRGDRVRPT